MHAWVMCNIPKVQVLLYRFMMYRFRIGLGTWKSNSFSRFATSDECCEIWRLKIDAPHVYLLLTVTSAVKCHLQHPVYTFRFSVVHPRRIVLTCILLRMGKPPASGSFEWLSTLELGTPGECGISLMVRRERTHPSACLIHCTWGSRTRWWSLE